MLLSRSLAPSPVHAQPPRKEPPPDVYLPTPEEIREACLEIQAGWTEAERIYRIRALPWEMSGTGGKKHRKNRLTCMDCGKAFVAWRANRCKACKRVFDRVENRHRLRAMRAARKAVAK